MGLRRDRKTPYAPQRQGIPIDYAAMQRESDAARAQVAAVNELALQSLAAFRAEADPWEQLIKRCHGMEGQITALTGVVGSLAEQVQTITTMLEASRNG